jgi:hypothetical protein
MCTVGFCSLRLLVPMLVLGFTLGSLVWLLRTPAASSAEVDAPQAIVADTGIDPRRQQVIDIMLAQLDKPYSLGSAGPDQFDCSGLVQWSYRQIGVDTTRTTFTQLKALPSIEAGDLQPGDLIFQQFPSDQHVVVWLGDLDGDGRGDVINAGGYLDGAHENVNIIYAFFEDHPVFMNAIIGYRRAL